MINKVIAIQNCGPSGTLLLQSLLDGHTQLLSLPALHGQQLLIQWETLQGKTKEEIINKLIAMNEHWFNPAIYPGEDLGLMSMGSSYKEIVSVNQDQFTKSLNARLSNLTQITRKEFLIAVYYAYNDALGRDTTNAEYLLYPIHSLPSKYAKQLKEDFEVVRFLHSIRNPIQSIGSMAKHIANNPGWKYLYVFNCVTSQMINDYTIHAGPHIAYGMKPYFRDSQDQKIQSRAVRLEDIHTALNITMKKICTWLNIHWEDTLLTSTFDGKIWNNRPASIRQTGVGDKIIAQKHTEVLSSFDKTRLEYATAKFMIHYRYETNCISQPLTKKLLMSLMVFLPFKMESFKIQIKERFAELSNSNSNKGMIRAHYGKLGRKLSGRLLSSRTVDLILVTFWLSYQYISCRIKCLIPAILTPLKKTEFVPLLDNI